MSRRAAATAQPPAEMDAPMADAFVGDQKPFVDPDSPAQEMDVHPGFVRQMKPYMDQRLPHAQEMDSGQVMNSPEIDGKAVVRGAEMDGNSVVSPVELPASTER